MLAISLSTFRICMPIGVTYRDGARNLKPERMALNKAPKKDFGARDEDSHH